MAHHQRAAQTCHTLPQPALRLFIICCPRPANGLIQLSACASLPASSSSSSSSAADLSPSSPFSCASSSDSNRYFFSLCSILSFVPHAPRTVPSLHHIHPSHIYPLSSLILESCLCRMKGCPTKVNKEKEEEEEKKDSEEDQDI